MANNTPMTPERHAALARARAKAVEVRRAIAAEKHRTANIDKDLAAARLQAKERELAQINAMHVPTQAPPRPRKAAATEETSGDSDSDEDSEESDASPDDEEEQPLAAPIRKSQASVPKHIKEYYKSKSEFYKSKAEAHRAKLLADSKRETNPMSHEAATVHVAKHVIREHAHEAYRRHAWGNLFPGVPYE